MSRLNDVIACVIAISIVVWTADLPRAILGATLMAQEFALWILGLCLLLTFLSRDYSGCKRDMTLLSQAPGWAAFGLCVYMAIRYRVMAEELYYHLNEAAVIGIFLIPLVLEALRRLVGYALVVIVLLFLAYGIFGVYLPEPVTARPWAVLDLAAHLSWDTTAMVGLPLKIGTTVVLPFILFGVVLAKSGGGDFFSDLAVATMGGLRGGSSKIAIVASALFGTISGSAVSNVASTGVISIPLMKRSGLSGKLAAATECVASTGGQLMPPVMGAAAFLMAEISQIPYQEIALAALLPAVFFFAAVFLQSDADSVKLGIKAIPASDRKKASSVLNEGWHFIPPFAVLIFALFELNWTPELSALSAAATTVCLSSFRSYAGTRFSLGILVNSFIDTGKQSIDIIVIVAAAGFVIGVLNATGLVFNMALIVIDLAGESLLILLLVTALVSIVLGMGMPTVAVYVLLATLVVPALVKAGVTPIAAHFFVLYFGMMSMITPPIAIAAFAAASLAGEKPLQVAFCGMRYAWLAYIIPFIFVLRPEFLLGTSSDFWSEFEVMASTILVLLLMGSALSGFSIRLLTLHERVLAGCIGAGVFFSLVTNHFQIYALLAGSLTTLWLWLELIKNGVLKRD
ncbi:TRAP transporter fused permease subunit [Litorivicinus sp.]|nr:TRAP transporter fused permease subunit [Litorivicinus sp.]